MHATFAPRLYDQDYTKSSKNVASSQAVEYTSSTTAVATAGVDRNGHLYRGPVTPMTRTMSCCGALKATTLYQQQNKLQVFL